MASVTDKIVSAAPVWTGQLASSIPDGTTTSFSLTSSSGLTDGEVYYFTIDRVDASGNKTPAKKEVIKGKLNGTNVVDCIRGVEGSAQAHSSGATVEILWTAAQWNDLKSHITTEHNQNGTHSNITATSVSTDTITEKTTDAGVTVDGCLIKDGNAAKATVLSTTAKAEAYMLNNQSISPNTWTKIAFDTKSYDPGNNFDTTNNRFVAPVAGYYLISAHAVYSSSEDQKRYIIAIYKNGSRIKTLYFPSSGTTSVSMTISAIIQLAVNDYVEIYTKHDSSVDKSVDGQSIFNDFSVHLLSV